MVWFRTDNISDIIHSHKTSSRHIRFYFIHTWLSHHFGHYLIHIRHALMKHYLIHIRHALMKHYLIHIRHDSHMWHGLSHHHKHYHIHLRHGLMRHHLIHITYFNTRDTISWDIRQRCPDIEAALDPRGVCSIDSFVYSKLFSCFVPCLTFDHGKVTCTAVPTLCLPIDVIYIIEIDCI